MDKKSIYKYLGLLEVDAPRNAQNVAGWVMARCPLAPWTHAKGYDKLPSFGVSINDKGKSGYNCFGCKHKGTLAGLAYKMANYADDSDYRDVGRQIERTEIIGLPDLDEWNEDDENDETQTTARKAPRPNEGNAFREYPPFYADNRAIQYLRDERQLDFSTARQLGLRWDRRQRRVLFPVYDHWTGQFEGFTGRSIYNTRELEIISERRGRNTPKIRDYFGLNKRGLLLGSRRGQHINGHNGRNDDWGLQHQNAARVARGTIIVEGLFAYARVKSYIRLFKLHEGKHNDRRDKLPIEVRALLGSELTDEKANILDNINAPIYWMVDDDKAGETCLQGLWDEDLHEHVGNGALAKFYGVLPQFRLEYPNGIDDPDDLSYKQYRKMLRKAKLHT